MSVIPWDAYEHEPDSRDLARVYDEHLAVMVLAAKNGDSRGQDFLQAEELAIRVSTGQIDEAIADASAMKENLQKHGINLDFITAKLKRLEDESGRGEDREGEWKSTVPRSTLRFTRLPCRNSATQLTMHFLIDLWPIEARP